MKIALLGYGKMGKLIEKIAEAQGHFVIARFSSNLGTLLKRKQELEDADIAIDFSHFGCLHAHLELCLSLNKPLVIGTTGWDENLEKAKSMVEEANGSCLYSPNFSIGVYLFQKIVAYAGALMQPFSAYDIGGAEIHHNQKKDHPSGTAKALTETLRHAMPRSKDFEFASVRCGQFPGTHTLYFDSSIDTITLTHEARSREGFAAGAIKGAEWLLSRQGFFTMDDFMKDGSNYSSAQVKSMLERRQSPGVESIEDDPIL